MFSYLRPHRRAPSSNPGSPALAEGLHSWGEPSPLHGSSDYAHSPRFQDASPQERPSASSSSPPPLLPSIANLSFSGPDLSQEYNIESTKLRPREHDPRYQPRETAKGNTRPREAPEYSSFKKPFATEQRPSSAGKAGGTQFKSFEQLGPLTESPKKTSKQKPSDSAGTFSPAADIYNRPAQTGRRPTGARVPPPLEKQPPISTFEPVQTRSSKTRLNLLNPMSLLARRRTSQAVAQLAPVSIVSNKTNSNTDSFDPRIRGTLVHDFSAPRPRKNVSRSDVKSSENDTNVRHYQRSPSGQYGDFPGTDESVGSPWSGGNHTPVFTENFEEEQYPAAGPHVRKASDISDLTIPKPPYAKDIQKRPEQNSTPLSPHTTERPPTTRSPGTDIGSLVPPKTDSNVPVENQRVSIGPSSTPPKSSPSRKGRSRNVSEVSARELALLGLPKHMKSTSSRFSFDMLGAAEQEKILEDRHREKALRKKNASPEGNDYDYEEEDEYDYDNMDDDDGLEERIPGVNADLEEEDNNDYLEEQIPGVNVDLEEKDHDGPSNEIENYAGFTFHQQAMSSLTSPVSPYSPGMVSTPRDANGEVIGFAMTKESPYIHMNSPLHTGQQSNTSPGSSASPDLSTSPGDDSDIRGLGLQGVDVDHKQRSEIPKFQDTKTIEFPTVSGIDDDDLYFDDGIIDMPGDDVDHVEFDESVFDNLDTDQYGRPLKSFSTLSTLYSPPMVKETPIQTVQETDEDEDDKEIASETKNNVDSILSPSSIPYAGGLAPQPSVIGAKTTQGLTQDTLMAYQSALAAAAQAAAASGKFRRESTSSEQEENQPSLIRDSSELSGYEPFSPSYDDFDYDDALEDDAIIAAANAEALANDCDGFYGQEFGFYSNPAASEAEYANGGYFGPRGVESINRSQSGRIALREPNLTPITERSEYSNRNSFMSLQLHNSLPPGALGSPGLAQLAGMMSGERDFEGDMSLNALLKLRSRAWGGSQASLHSSNGSLKSPICDETTSPMGQLPPWAVASPNSISGHRKQNSTFSLVSEEASPNVVGTAVASGASSAPASPTLTMGTPGGPAKEKDGDLKMHRHTGSSDSISYLKENDPVEGKRWVLERRRTAESGEIELQREVVLGGRI